MFSIIARVTYDEIWSGSEKFEIVSCFPQVLHFVGLVASPKQDSTGDSYFYTEQDLPHMINPLEAKLGQSLRV